VFTEGVRQYLEDIRVPLRLACATPSGWPMVLSLWYICRDGHFYCATQRTAKVVSYLRHDPRCGFEVASDSPPYCGVRGQGRATLDEGLGSEILQQLLLRYLDGTDNPLAMRLLARSDHEVAIVIKPVNVFKWNFTDRMKGSIEIVKARPCPD
jgi:hypothetical protein